MAIDRITETIARNESVLGGQPHVVGTTIPVTAVLDLLAEGIFPQEIITKKHLPQLKLDQVYTCIAFASQALKTIKW
jgi:uncharacterized protein (DUF433 family)